MQLWEKWAKNCRATKSTKKGWCFEGKLFIVLKPIFFFPEQHQGGIHERRLTEGGAGGRRATYGETGRPTGAVAGSKRLPERSMQAVMTSGFCGPSTGANGPGCCRRQPEAARGPERRCGSDRSRPGGGRSEAEPVRPRLRADAGPQKRRRAAWLSMGIVRWDSQGGASVTNKRAGRTGGSRQGLR